MGETFGNGGGTQACDGGGAGERPSICVAIIVKNEEDTVLRALESARTVATCWCVMDTGSTDKTLEVLHNYAAENVDSYPGKICQGPFQDFSQARNLLYEHAKDQAEWLLLMDADDQWVDAEYLLEEISEEIDGLIVTTIGTPEYWNIRLIRSGLPWEYIGRAHEMLQPVSQRLRRSGAKLNTQMDGRFPREKYVWYAELLEQDVKEFPEDEYSVCRLGNTYHLLECYKEAIVCFKKAISLSEQGGDVYYWANIGLGISLQEIDLIAEAEEAFMVGAYSRPEQREALVYLFLSLNKRHAYAQLSTVAEIFAGTPCVTVIEKGSYSWEAPMFLVPFAWQSARLEWAIAELNQGNLHRAKELFEQLQSEGIATELTDQAKQLEVFIAAAGGK